MIIQWHIHASAHDRHPGPDTWCDLLQLGQLPLNCWPQRSMPSFVLCETALLMHSPKPLLNTTTVCPVA